MVSSGGKIEREVQSGKPLGSLTLLSAFQQWGGDWSWWRARSESRCVPTDPGALFASVSHPSLAVLALCMPPTVTLREELGVQTSRLKKTPRAMEAAHILVGVMGWKHLWFSEVSPQTAPSGHPVSCPQVILFPLPKCTTFPHKERK